MQATVVCYATIRDAVGRKRLEREFPAGTGSVACLPSGEAV